MGKILRGYYKDCCGKSTRCTTISKSQNCIFKNTLREMSTCLPYDRLPLLLLSRAIHCPDAWIRKSRRATRGENEQKKSLSFHFLLDVQYCSSNKWSTSSSSLKWSTTRVQMARLTDLSLSLANEKSLIVLSVGDWTRKGRVSKWMN